MSQETKDLQFVANSLEGTEFHVYEYKADDSSDPITLVEEKDNTGAVVSTKAFVKSEDAENFLFHIGATTKATPIEPPANQEPQQSTVAGTETNTPISTTTPAPEKPISSVQTEPVEFDPPTGETMSPAKEGV